MRTSSWKNVYFSNEVSYNKIQIVIDVDVYKWLLIKIKQLRVTKNKWALLWIDKYKFKRYCCELANKRFKILLWIKYKFHEVLFILCDYALEMFGLVSGRRVQRRYSLSETTLQQGNFRGMVHNCRSVDCPKTGWSHFLSFL